MLPVLIFVAATDTPAAAGRWGEQFAPWAAELNGRSVQSLGVGASVGDDFPYACPPGVIGNSFAEDDQWSPAENERGHLNV